MSLVEIAIPKGGTGSYTFTLTQNGVAINLAGKSLTFTVVAYAGGPELFKLRNTAAGGNDTEIEVLDAAAGIVKVKFTESDTLTVPHGVYYCDMWMDDGTDHLQVVPLTPFRVKARAKATS